MREGPVADPRNARRRPLGFGRRAGEGYHVERQRHFAHHPLHLLRIGQAGNEETARAGIGERLAALDHLIDQRIVMLLALRNRSVRALMKKVIANRTADRLDPADLQVERMHALASDHLILEIASDRAGFA